MFLKTDCLSVICILLVSLLRNIYISARVQLTFHSYGKSVCSLPKRRRSHLLPGSLFFLFCTQFLYCFIYGVILCGSKSTATFRDSLLHLPIHSHLLCLSYDKQSIPFAHYGMLYMLAPLTSINPDLVWFVNFVN